MEAVKQIRELRRNSNNIYQLFLKNIPHWKDRQQRYDKVSYGFNIDSRFNACEAIAIAFSSSMGIYGDSGCSRQCDLNKDIFRKHFVKYLNDHQEEIMLAVAKSIDKEALSLKEQAEKELNDQLQNLSDLEKEVKSL